MSTLVAQTISNGSVSTSSANVIQGSAKAWVNFNGTGTVAIRASYNVSSVTDNGTGDYTINFTNAFADTNYAISVEGYAVGNNYTVKRSTITKTTTTFNFGIAGWGGAAASNTFAADAEFVSVAIFR